MTIGMTLCSGIGAPEAAAPWVDWRFASDIEAFPRAVLSHRHGLSDARHTRSPARALWGDFTALRVRHLRRLGAPLPDLIVAGTPCQAFSLAGRRKGMRDARGGLTLSFVELIHAIANARRHDGSGGFVCLWENVPGVLSDKDNAFGCFLGALVGARDPLPSPDGGSWPGVGMVSGGGVRVAWRVLDAQYFGVAQRRRRVFAVIDIGGRIDPAAVLFEPRSVRRDPPSRRAPRESVAGTIEASAGKGRGAGTSVAAMNVADVAPTLSARANGGGGLGTDFDCDGGLVAANSGATSYCLAASAQQSLDAETETLLAVTPFDTTAITSPENGSRPVAGAPCHTLGAGQHAPAIAIQERAGASGAAGPGGSGISEKDVAYTLEARTTAQAVCALGETANTLTSEGFDASEDGSGRGTPVVAFTAKDYGGDATIDASPPLRAGGFADSHANGGVTPAVAFGLRGRDGGAAPEGPHDTASLRAASGGSSRSYVADALVRRLTPVECERLQGFPDGFTAISTARRNKALECADTRAWARRHAPELTDDELDRMAADGPRYRALGNSMAVPVIAWILNRVHAQMEEWI